MFLLLVVVLVLLLLVLVVLVLLLLHFTPQYSTTALHLSAWVKPTQRLPFRTMPPGLSAKNKKLKGNSQFRQALADVVQICKDAGAVEPVLVAHVESVEPAVAATAAATAASEARVTTDRMRLAMKGRGY